jgi:ABC-type proline/glycine betaine transport system substrate-binding protein
MKLKSTVSAALLAGGMTLSGVATAADVVIGVPNWPSVAATANVLKVIIEDNLGLEVELQNGTNPIVFEAMDSGAMHAHPEVWMPNQQNLHDTFVKTKGTVAMNPNGVPAFQGMCVPKAFANKHGIKSIDDLTNPDTAALFDGDGDGRGEVWRQGRGLDRCAGLGVDQRRKDPRQVLRLRPDIRADGKRRDPGLRQSRQRDQGRQAVGRFLLHAALRIRTA